MSRKAKMRKHSKKHRKSRKGGWQVKSKSRPRHSKKRKH